MADRIQMRCVQCGTIDYPRAVRRGPGWIAVLLWAATGIAWAVSWTGTVPILSAVFWVLLFASLVYTLWYFWKQETACRSCGARELESHGTGSAV